MIPMMTRLLQLRWVVFGVAVVFFGFQFIFKSEVINWSALFIMVLAGALFWLHRFRKSQGDKTRFYNILLASLSGAFYFLGFETVNQFYFSWFAFVPLFFAIRNSSYKTSFYLGWWTGTFTNILGFYWISGLLMNIAYLPVGVAVPLCVLLALYQAIKFGLWALALRYLADQSKWSFYLLGPVLLVLSEYFFPLIFPYYTANSQHYFLPIIQIAEITGVWGVTFLITLVNTTLFELLRYFVQTVKQRGSLLLIKFGAGFILYIAALVFGLVRIEQIQKEIQKAPKLKIGLVQANIPIYEKDKFVERNLRLHQSLTADLIQKYNPDLVLWPETAYGYGYLEKSPKGEYTVCAGNSCVPPASLVRKGFDTPILFGGVFLERRPDLKIFNSAFMMQADGGITGHFNKNYILVFGEYVPFESTFPWLRRFFPHSGGLSKGTEVNVLPFKNFRIGVLICYEDILPIFAREMAKNRPHIFINLTNDAWFGKSTEPALHASLAVFRAVEHRLYLIRSTNTGISCYIDAIGRIYSRTGIFEKAIMGESAAMLSIPTLYQRFGDFFVTGCLLFILVFLLIKVGRFPKSPQT